MDYPMIKTGTDTWTLTITGVPVANFQYKFTLGSWSSVEETSSCGSVPNRTFGFDTADATYPANDTVAAWAGRRLLLKAAPVVLLTEQLTASQLTGASARTARSYRL
jgi:hypothetical protein